MINFPDLCGFGSDTRMNIPGVAEGCWRYRASNENFERADREYYKSINRLFKRI
jgi:4-alpha-glucanotransferase